MDIEEFKRQLETQRKQLSATEYFDKVLELLGENPTHDERKVLEHSLVAFSDVDPDRAARYWGQLLTSKNDFQKEAAAQMLVVLVRSYDNALAYRLLSGFFGQEPTADKIDDILRERMLRLFPGSKGKQ